VRVTVLGIDLFGEGLRDTLDPRLKVWRDSRAGPARGGGPASTTLALVARAPAIRSAARRRPEATGLGGPPAPGRARPHPRRSSGGVERAQAASDRRRAW